RNQDNKHKESLRRTVPVETSTPTALVSCDGLGGYDWSDQAEEGLNYALMAFSSSSSDSKVFKVEIQIGEIVIRELRKKLKVAQKEKDGIQLNVDKFEHASKSLNKLIDCQIVDNCKKSLGYENYNAVPPPFLSFTSLEEFVNKPVVENCKAKSSEEKPKVVRKNVDAPIIEEWVSNNEEKDVSQPKIENKIVRPSIVKKEFVKSKQQRKIARKTVKKVEQHRQNTYNMMSQKLGSNFEMFNKSCYVCGSFDHLQVDCNYHQKQFQNKRMIKPVWNNAHMVNHQNFAKKTHPFTKKNMVSRAVLMKSGLVSIKTARQNISKTAVLVNTARQVNAAHSKTTVNAARSISYLSKIVHSTVKRPIHKKTSFKNNNVNQRFNTVRENGNSFKPVPRITSNADGTSTSTISCPVTAKEKARKKNNVKARSMLLMALPNEHLLTFSQYKDSKTLFEAIQARFGGNDATKKTQKTLLKQMYKNFNAPSTDTIKVDTTSIQVSVVSTPDSTVSSPNNTANLSDATVYDFLANQPNGSQLVHEDLEQIHEDDLEEMDLKWQLALLRYDKTKVECFNFYKMGHFARKCRSPRNQESRLRNQDSSRKTGIMEDTSSIAMVAIDGAGFDWSYLGDDEVLTNMTLMAFLDSELPDENQVLLKVPRKNNMYSFDLKIVVPSKGLTCLFAKATNDKSNLWLRRLAHINFKTMDKVVKGNLVRGLPSMIFENDHTCVSCKKRKEAQSLLYRWVFFLAKKDETCGILKDFITGIENQLIHKVKIIRCDNMTEFKNYEMNQFFGIKGIKGEFSNAKTPQQNGVAERKNSTLIEAARTMLADSLLPIPFWAEAVNCLLCTEQGKFDGKADEGFLVGYSLNSKAFRVYNRRTKKAEEIMHVNFLENKPNVAGSGSKIHSNVGHKGKEKVSDQEYILLPVLNTSSDVHLSNDEVESSPKVGAGKKSIVEPTCVQGGKIDDLGCLDQ
nr:hypothetical protein [Tanacetum cinerariifolium]